MFRSFAALRMTRKAYNDNNKMTLCSRGIKKARNIFCCGLAYCKTKAINKT